jgi:hypothetical protein
MKLESQVVSLDLAKRLKELGVKQESYFRWVSENTVWCFAEGEQNDPPKYRNGISAFTVAELGEMLPHQIIRDGDPCEFIQVKSPSGQYGIKLQQYVPQFGSMFYKQPKEYAFFLKDTEADARAKMLIYLVENKLISIPIS